MKTQKPPSFADDILTSVDRAKEKKQQKDENYQTWRKSKSPEDLLKVVEQYQPVIDNAAHAIIGRHPDGVVRRRAQLLAAEAVQSYDPKKNVPLKYHIQTNLSPLRRWHRKVTEIVPIPERLRREAAQLNQAREELWEELDREPTEEEIADRTGISVKKQMKMRRRSRRGVSEGELVGGAMEDDESADFSPAVDFVDPGQEVIDYVYFDLDPEDQFLYRSRTGYRGAPILSNQEVARKLKISPGAVSQRANKIEKRIREFLDE